MIPEVEQLTNELLLHVTPAVRRDAQLYSEKHGLSVDQFVNLAVTEKVAQIQHQEWLMSRRPMTEERRLRALAILDRAGTEPPQPGDELPEGYVPLPFTGSDK